MAGRFLGTRLAMEMLRHVTQPLSKTIVRHVKKHPFFREYVLVQLGRLYYWCQNVIRYNQTPRLGKMYPVNDVLAMELGTQMLLEALIFAFLMGALIYETTKGTQRSQCAEAKITEEMNALVARKDELKSQIENQRIAIQSLKDFIKEYSREINCPLPDLPEDSCNDKDTPRS